MRQGPPGHDQQAAISQEDSISWTLQDPPTKLTGPTKSSTSWSEVTSKKPSDRAKTEDIDSAWEFIIKLLSTDEESDIDDSQFVTFSSVFDQANESIKEVFPDSKQKHLHG